MAKQNYKVAKNPNDGQWYIVGYCGEGFWIPVSDSYESKEKALSHISKQILADRDAKRIVATI